MLLKKTMLPLGSHLSVFHYPKKQAPPTADLCLTSHLTSRLRIHTKSTQYISFLSSIACENSHIANMVALAPAALYSHAISSRASHPSRGRVGHHLGSTRRVAVRPVRAAIEDEVRMGIRRFFVSTRVASLIILNVSLDDILAPAFSQSFYEHVYLAEKQGYCFESTSVSVEESYEILRVWMHELKNEFVPGLTPL